MVTKAQEALDRHITGNYGEDQYDEHGEYPAKLFDITCVIGSVYAGNDEPARSIAFRMIAEHDADGHFTFPTEDGFGVVHITVETERKS